MQLTSLDLKLTWRWNEVFAEQPDIEWFHGRFNSCQKPQLLFYMGDYNIPFATNCRVGSISFDDGFVFQTNSIDLLAYVDEESEVYDHYYKCFLDTWNKGRQLRLNLGRYIWFHEQQLQRISVLIQSDSLDKENNERIVLETCRLIVNEDLEIDVPFEVLIDHGVECRFIGETVSGCSVVDMSKYTMNRK